MKHQELENLLRQTAPPGGQPFSAASVEKFSNYYQLVLKWNARLHLTTIIEPRAFLQRHLLEAAWVTVAIDPAVNEVWDIGSGLGVPGVIIAILRPDLSVVLVEASSKKSVFLEEVRASLRLANLKVSNGRFQDLPQLPAYTCLTARALEKMEAELTALLTLASHAQQVLLLGNEGLKNQTAKWADAAWRLREQLLPNSEHRWLIGLSRS